ncbi:MAG: TspO/MBR family protein [Patescibacteria group bacterium]|jgi:benzodiazapine receptor
MSWQMWYESLEKPSWTPSVMTISVIWSFLYPIILISFGYILYRTLKGDIKKSVFVVFAINLVANLLFTPILFGLRSLILASLDILIVLGTIVLGMITIWPYSKTLSLVQVPYLIWVSIATVLQFSILSMN